jgi:hypothetical protein
MVLSVAGCASVHNRAECGRDGVRLPRWLRYQPMLVRTCVRVGVCACGRRAPVRVTVRAGEGYSCRKRGEVCAGCFCHGCRNGGTVVAAASGTPTSPPPGSGSVTAQQYQQIGGMHEVVHTYDEEGRLRYARGDPCPRSLSPS